MSARPVVVKRDGAWAWECHPTCARGAKGYKAHSAALSALFIHLRVHRGFGFQRGVIR